MTIGEKLAKARKEKNFTQEQLAKLMDVTRQSVSRWESNLAYPEVDKIVELSKILDINCDYLLKDDVDESGQKEEYDIDNDREQADDNFGFYHEDNISYTNTSSHRRQSLANVDYTYGIFARIHKKYNIKFFISLYLFVISTIMIIAGSTYLSINYSIHDTMDDMTRNNNKNESRDAYPSDNLEDIINDVIRKDDNIPISQIPIYDPFDDFDDIFDDFDDKFDKTKDAVNTMTTVICSVIIAMGGIVFIVASIIMVKCIKKKEFFYRKSYKESKLKEVE